MKRNHNGNPFQPASKQQARLRLALIGPSGSGKTFTALRIASGLASGLGLRPKVSGADQTAGVVGNKVALIDTERGSASKYADIYDFDVMELVGDYHPQRYIEAIQAAVKERYDVLVIDSLSHAWAGSGGVLEQVDRITRRSQAQNSFMAWRDVTPIQNALVDTMLMSDLHLIVTLRTKTDYVITVNEKGKQVPRKVGLAPVQREGLDYEFDVVADMDLDNVLSISKSRCPALTGAVIPQPQDEIAQALLAWLSEGAKPAPGAYVVDWSDDLRNRDVAEAFVEYWNGQELENEDILSALGIKRLSEWTQGRQVADQQILAWIEKMTTSNKRKRKVGA